VAKDSGLGRESLYKALAPGAKPPFDTVLKVARALGVKLTARPSQQGGIAPVEKVRPDPAVGELDPLHGLPAGVAHSVDLEPLLRTSPAIPA
jgi:hypothetical protein